jgi:hypothetical protein
VARAETSSRVNVTLDAEHAQRLKRMAEQAYTSEGTLARSLLSRAIDDAEVDGRTMVEILNGIPGVGQRIELAREQHDPEADEVKILTVEDARSSNAATSYRS